MASIFYAYVSKWSIVAKLRRGKAEYQSWKEEDMKIKHTNTLAFSSGCILDSRERERKEPELSGVVCAVSQGGKLPKEA
ncbi:hypothetical protein EK904_009420 [Melospiza melodia maxima]|nr:hypothetical protein EK904_009420 [Melospiza melodia maxima]